MNKGFTLIEIMVVLIILGGLTALAIPEYFSWIKRSYISEALASLNQYKGQMKLCMLTHPGLEISCNNGALGVVNSDNFQYFATSGGNGTQTWTIMAVPLNGNRAGLGLWDTVHLSNDTLGSITCSGTGIFQGPC